MLISVAVVGRVRLGVSETTKRRAAFVIESITAKLAGWLAARRTRGIKSKNEPHKSQADTYLSCLRRNPSARSTEPLPCS